MDSKYDATNSEFVTNTRFGRFCRNTKYGVASDQILWSWNDFCERQNLANWWPKNRRYRCNHFGNNGSHYHCPLGDTGLRAVADAILSNKPEAALNPYEIEPLTSPLDRAVRDMNVDALRAAGASCADRYRRHLEVTRQLLRR